MLNEEEKMPNNEQQSEEVLNQENNQKSEPKFAMWKRGVLLAIGIAGLYGFAFLAVFMVQGLPKSDRSASINLIAYSFLFATMMAVVFMDIPKFIHKFKGWKPYVFALAFAGGILVFDIFYTNIVNLFRPIDTSSNEASVRSVIDLYPVASIFILGIIGPLCEELAYRVGLFGLLRRVNRILAYAVTGIVFGFLHFDFTSPDIVNEFIFLPTYIFPGIAFAVAYDLFGLPCSWTAHSINNLFAIIAHLLLNHLQNYA